MTRLLLGNDTLRAWLMFAALETLLDLFAERGAWCLGSAMPERVAADVDCGRRLCALDDEACECSNDPETFEPGVGRGPALIPAWLANPPTEPPCFFFFEPWEPIISERGLVILIELGMGGLLSL